MAHSLLPRRLRRRVDPDDVVSATWMEFFLATPDTTLPPEPWPLLSTILARQVFRQVERHQAARRNIQRDVEQFPEVSGKSGSVETHRGTDIEGLISTWPSRDQRIVELRTQGYEQAEIASLVGCSERTVRRLMHRIQVEMRANRCEGRWKYGELLLTQFLSSDHREKVYLARCRDGIVVVRFLRRSEWSSMSAVHALLDEAARTDSTTLQVIGWGTTPQGGLFLVQNSGPNPGQSSDR